MLCKYYYISSHFPHMESQNTKFVVSLCPKQFTDNSNAM